MGAIEQFDGEFFEVYRGARHHMCELRIFRKCKTGGHPGAALLVGIIDALPRVLLT